jgi:cytochrome c oxidase subunit I
MNPPRSGFAAPPIAAEGRLRRQGGAASGLAKPDPRRPLGCAALLREHLTASAPADYRLPIGGDRTLARGWLFLALAALIGSGLFSVLLVLARTPGINALLPAGDFFRTALVVHVDLSVLVWFVSIAAMLWTLNGRSASLSLCGLLALALCGLGTAMMAAAPFLPGAGAPVMANYIPLLDGALFRAGLVVFGAGALVLTLRTMASAPQVGAAALGQSALRFGLNATAAATAVALLAFAASLALTPRELPDKAYYELLFWGGGHALQFVWTLLMLVGWLVLAQACGARIPLPPRVVLLLFALAMASVFVTPVAYLAYEISTVEHRNLHTWAMRFGGGVAILPPALAVGVAIASARPLAPVQRPLRAALLASMLLFAAGGLIGLAINGANVKIPAHYHGCIVGVTLALMGLVFHLLPRLGYAAPQGRLAVAQPWLYGIGQLLHISALVWSGGYGVQRKVAGAEQVLRSSGEVAGMALMGLGGLLAIVGGLLFVVVVLRAMHRRR